MTIDTARTANLTAQLAMLPEPQWRAETLQVANWGGFEGPTTVEFAPTATLLSGPSGAGKSTLLDAYIALVMDSGTSFNGASNEAQVGRARSSEQRNLLTYLRGKLDTTEDDGREVDVVLRGRHRPTWGALAMTFVSDHGQRFTAARAYWVPSRATRPSDITMRMLTIDGPFNVADLEPFAVVGEEHFPTQALRAAFATLRTHDKYAGFAQALFTRLGIGTNGDGAKALRLLARIQAGQHIRTVDELYKDMVLEKPDTFEKADLAIGHFNALEANYAAMVNDQAKAQMLRPITALFTERCRAADHLAALDTLGLTAAGDTPSKLWQLRTRSALYDVAIADNRDAAAKNRQLRAAIADEERIAADLAKSAAAAYAGAGGNELARLTQTLEDLRGRLGPLQARRTTLQEAARDLNASLDGESDFLALKVRAATFATDLPTRKADIARRRDEATAPRLGLFEAKRAAETERDSLRVRGGRIPADLDLKRRQAAEAAGLPVDDLPFAAELLDIPPHQSPWRLAIETVLAPTAYTLLVPAEHLDRFSRAINDLDWKTRVHFEGAERWLPSPTMPTDEAMVSAKLTYKDDSPYIGWLRQQVLRNDHRCVTSPDQLAGTGPRVATTGQTRSRLRGAHGRSGRSFVIGFDNADLIEQLQQQIATYEAQLTDIDNLVRRLEDERDHLDEHSKAFHTIAQATFEEIDVWSCEHHINTITAQRERLLNADDNLKQLAEAADDLKNKHEAVVVRRGRLDSDHGDLETRHGDLVEAQDIINTDLYRIEDAGDVTVDTPTQQLLDSTFAEVGGGNLDGFDEALVRMTTRLSAQAKDTQGKLKAATEALERCFTQYRDTWEQDNPNLGVSIDSYGEYAQILETIESTGLHARREKWRKAVVDWSGEDLVPLAHSMTSAVDDIEDRLGPINSILLTLPFGATSDRLQMRIRRLHRQNVTDFRAELKRLSSQATSGLSDNDLERRFADLQAFMATIRERTDIHLPAKLAHLSDRDRLLDVRKHVEITAERHDVRGKLRSTHSSLAGKSGGETQELVAFIVGAALRYRLGDDLRSRPRFAPVVIDEGFIKSDSEFAGRAVQAWQGLGFQLIIGAPLDKVTALEPYAALVLAITKRLDTGYSYVTPIRDATTTAGDA